MMILSAIKMARRNLILCLTVLWACGSVYAEKTPATESVEDLMRRGVSAENGNRPADAAEAYEKLLQRDTTFESTVGPRLVSLYVTLKDPASALSWAARIARQHPAPEAYLAGVHSRLNQNKEAELLLRQALRGTSDPLRRVPLLWQLAETQEKQGLSQEALTTLANARDAAKTKGQQETAARRLETLQQRLAGTQVQTRAGKPRQTEDKP